jgi:DNA-damage-inducible protein J
MDNGKNNDVVHFRINGELKLEVTAILERCGLSLSDACRLLCHQIALQNGLPFDITSARTRDSSQRRSRLLGGDVAL